MNLDEFLRFIGHERTPDSERQQTTEEYNPTLQQVRVGDNRPDDGLERDEILYEDDRRVRG